MYNLISITLDSFEVRQYQISIQWLEDVLNLTKGLAAKYKGQHKMNRMIKFTVYVS